MQALILAGGFGTRLSHIVKDLPKPMAPIQNKPFLEILISYLKKQGINDIILLTGYKSESIEAYFQEGKKSGLSVRYSIEKEPLGTGGAVKKAALTMVQDEDFLLINGDTYFDVDCKYLMDFHKRNAALLTIALKYKEDVKRYGSVRLEDGRIMEFIEKSDCLEDGLINGGVSVLSKKALQYFKKDGFLSIEKEVMPLLLDEGKVYGVPFGGKFIDIGVPRDYYRAGKEIPGWLKKPKIKAAFLDRDGVLNVDEGYTHKAEDLRLVDGVIPFLKDLRKMGFKFIIITNQAGIGKGLFKNEDYDHFQETLLKKLSREGIEIIDSFYSPYHPEAVLEEYKKESLLRKPGPGMVLLAADKHHIDLNRSIMIGDRDSDRIRLPYLRSFILKSRYGSNPEFKTYADFNEITEALKNGK